MKLIASLILVVFLIGSILPCLASDSLEVNTASDFQFYLDKLDSTNWNSIPRAKQVYLSSVRELPSSAKDSLFRSFTDFHNKVIWKGSDAYFDSVEYSKIPDELDEFGLRFIYIEGNYDIETNPKFLLELAEYLDSPFGEVMRFNYRETQETWFNDAVVCMSWDEMRKRIVRYEKMITKYPDLIETGKLLKNNLNRLIPVYFEGMENSRIFEWSDSKLSESAKISFETYILENIDSGYHDEVVEAYDILKKHDYKYSSEYSEFLRLRVFSQIKCE